MSNEASWPEGFLEALEDAISVCASRFKINQTQKAALESALQQAFGKPISIDYASRK